MSERTLIINANLLTMANIPLAQGLNQVLIEQGKIVAIGQDLGAADASLIDAKGAIVMPGMIDTHRHVWQSLLRAQLCDGTLYDYMAILRYGFAPHISAEEAELGNYAGALDALNSGITTVVDHAHLVSTPDHADALLTGLEAAGIRAVFCYGLADVSDPGKQIDATRAFETTWRHKDAERFRASRLPGSDGLVRFGIGGSEFLFAPLKFTEAEVKTSRRLDAHTFSVHVANGPFARGTRYVSRLLKKGLVDDRTLLVHGNVLTRADLAHISVAGASIVSTPESEMQMGMGTPIWPLAKETGVPCGLGADIVSGGAGDPFTFMRLALAAGRMAANDKLAIRRIMPARLTLTAEDALRAVTIEGARAAGLESEVGSIEIGKKADLVFLRANGVQTVPVFDLTRLAVMQSSIADVDTVMVEGKILKAEGRLRAGNQSEIVARLQKAGERIVAATPKRSLEDAYAYVSAAFPLDALSALGARIAGFALRVPGLDKLVFKQMLARSNSARLSSTSNRS